VPGDEGARDDSYHARRQRRATTTLLVVILMLSGAFYYASTYFQASAPKPGPCQTIISVAELRPADISVNVFNATQQGGLARGVAQVLAARGFKVKEIANDPLDKAIKGVAELRHGPDGLESAKVLQRHLPTAVLVADKREGDTVDLVIGTGYRRMGAIPPPATAVTTAIPCPPVTVTR
jgi:hypothetical protein